MNLTNSYPMNNSTLIPFKTRFENSLKEPIVQKCYILSQLIHESISTNIKEIQLNFVSLIEDIFSFGSHSTTSEWGLKLISQKSNPREFESIYAFLHVNGNVFQLIRQLMNDPMNRYEFPKSCLPMPTKLSLEEGIIPSFYANKISHGFANTISLNALEFYLFHFAYYMLNNSPNVYYQQNHYYLEQLRNANANPSNNIYFALLESYLSYFVPLSNSQIVAQQNHSSQSSIWQSLSSTTSSFLNLGNASNSASPKRMSSPQTSTLFKSSILNLKPLLSTGHQSESNEHTFQRIAHDSLGTEIVKCETFLLIVTELWLNHAIPHSVNKKQISPSKQMCFTPNADHMRAVRILVKHLHYFANSYNKRINERITIDSSPLDDMRRSLWSPKYLFQKKLYSFLRLSFDRWPNDTSFRLPLETWLSYIQPWRYTNPLNESRHNLETDERDVAINNTTPENPLAQIDQRWKQFVSDNLLFYSVIFRQLIPRFSKLLDLSAAKNALMLYRLTKVFSQYENLSVWIREAEVSLMNSDTSLLQNNWISNTRASLLTPTIRQQNASQMTANFRHPLMELESNTFECIPLFCHSIKPLIMQLLTEISKALLTVNEMIISANNKSEMPTDSGSSIVRFIKFIFQLYDDSSQSDDNKAFVDEKTKTRVYLNEASSQLSKLFNVPEVRTYITSDQNEDSIGQNSSLLLRHRTSDSENLAQNRTLTYEEDPNGTPKLTSLGRYQVLNRLCKPELNTLEGNPDEQPVRTYEIYYLVRLLLFISVWINTRYGQQIQRLYNRRGFIGTFFRQLISGPTSYTRVVKNGTFRPPERVTETLPARINIRFLANKTYLLYAFIVIALVYIFNYSLISFSFLAFFMFFTYLLTKTLLIHLSSNVIN